MKRQPIKTISNKPIEYIPKEYADMDINAEKIEDRPIIFIGKKVTREQRYAMQEQTDLVYPEGVDLTNEDDVKKNVKVVGKGKAFKYIWDNNIIEVKNAILDEDGVIKTYESLTGKDKDKVWNSEGNETEILGAISFFMAQSRLEEPEAKN